jgi:hypothetical protein
MISALTYAHAILWACLPPVVFAVVSDRAGMNRQTRLVCLRVLWLVPALIACATVLCGVMLLIFP